MTMTLYPLLSLKEVTQSFLQKDVKATLDSYDYSAQFFIYNEKLYAVMNNECHLLKEGVYTNFNGDFLIKENRSIMLGLKDEND